MIPLDNLSLKLGIELYAKCEGLNPTGSFKNRGMVLAVLKLSSQEPLALYRFNGNTSASLQANAAKAKIKCHVFSLLAK